MKKFTTAIILLIVYITLDSCLKDSIKKDTDSGKTNLTASSILSGKWAIVTDSVSTKFWGIWDGKAPVESTYIGKAGDYYDFGLSGKLSVHQDTSSYTKAYKISKDTIFVQYQFIDGQTNKPDSAYNTGYMITHLTSNTCTLTSFFISPETATTSIVNLRKE